jgi:hypothetical protein
MRDLFRTAINTLVENTDTRFGKTSNHLGISLMASGETHTEPTIGATADEFLRAFIDSTNDELREITYSKDHNHPEADIRERFLALRLERSYVLHWLLSKAEVELKEFKDEMRKCESGASLEETGYLDRLLDLCERADDLLARHSYVPPKCALASCIDLSTRSSDGAGYKGGTVTRG